MADLRIPLTDGSLVLDPLEVPDGLVGWNGILPFGSSEAADDAAHDGVVVNVLLETPATEADLDLVFVSGVLSQVDSFLAAGAAAVRDAVEAEPERFGASPEGTFGLDSPELTFGAGRTWTLRFADCSLPASTELGVAVYFDGADPVQVDELSDAGDHDDDEHEHDEHGHDEHGHDEQGH